MIPDARWNDGSEWLLLLYCLSGMIVRIWDGGLDREISPTNVLVGREGAPSERKEMRDECKQTMTNDWVTIFSTLSLRFLIVEASNALHAAEWVK